MRRKRRWIGRATQKKKYFESKFYWKFKQKITRKIKQSNCCSVIKEWTSTGTPSLAECDNINEFFPLAPRIRLRQRDVEKLISSIALVLHFLAQSTTRDLFTRKSFCDGKCLDKARPFHSRSALHSYSSSSQSFDRELFPWLTTSERTQTKSASSFCMSASKCAERGRKKVGKVGREEEKFYILCVGMQAKPTTNSRTLAHTGPQRRGEWQRERWIILYNHIYSTGRKYIYILTYI